MSVLEVVVDPKEWCERYSLNFKSWECVRCKKKFEWKIPIRARILDMDYVGIKGDVSDHPECGENYTQSQFRPIGKKSIEYWKDILG